MTGSSTLPAHDLVVPLTLAPTVYGILAAPPAGVVGGPNAAQPGTQTNTDPLAPESEDGETASTPAPNPAPRTSWLAPEPAALLTALLHALIAETVEPVLLPAALDAVLTTVPSVESEPVATPQHAPVHGGFFLLLPALGLLNRSTAGRQARVRETARRPRLHCVR
jgi:hypothetical protein